MGLLSWLFPEGSGDERRHAETLGMAVSDVERELPSFSSRNRLEALSMDSCVRYALPRRGCAPRVPWNFQQRTKAQGAQFPNGYLLVAAGEIKSELHERLRQVAEEYDEELFEFEGTDQEVAVYWAEWGGNEQVEKLHKTLSVLAAY
jgi:hypothetical protein